MKLISLWSAIILILLTLGPATGTAGQPLPGDGLSSQRGLDRFSAEQKARLLAGEILFESVITEGPEGRQEGSGRTVTLINKPVAECFRIFCLFDKQHLYYPRMTVSRVLKQEGNSIVIYKEIRYLVATVKYTHLLTLDPQAHRVDYVTDPEGENSIKFTSGYYLFEKVDEQRSLFTYELTRAEPDLNIPKFIKEYLASKDLPSIAANIRKRIESGGTWEK